jgi:hypothetical protein
MYQQHTFIERGSLADQCKHCGITFSQSIFYHVPCPMHKDKEYQDKADYAELLDLIKRGLTNFTQHDEYILNKFNIVKNASNGLI